MKKIVLLAFVLVLLSTAVVVRFTRPVIADGTLYIKADGSVVGTDKIQRDGNVYTFIANIYDSIVVERDNIVVNGAGYTLQGTGAIYSKGIDLTGRSNVTIKNMEIKAFYYGTWLNMSSSNSISGNNIKNNIDGIWLTESSNNIIYHNNFINNTQQVYDYSWDWVSVPPSINIWDDGYPSGGNYWSDYNGTDDDQDGIGDSPYIIFSNNQDNYPLMGMFYDFAVEIGWGQIYHVYVISNSTVSNLEVLWWLTSPNEYLQPGQKFIQFCVAGEEDSVGFCRLMIPRVVLNGSYIVLVDWHEVPVTELPISNSTHAYLYFTYIHSMHEVIIVPEFPTWTSMLLILIVLTFAVASYKRRLLKTPIH